MSSSCDILLKKLDAEISKFTNLTTGLLPKKDLIDSLLNDVVGEDIQDILDSTDTINDKLDAVVYDTTNAINDSGDPCGIVDNCLSGITDSIKGMANIDLPLLSSPSFGNLPIIDSLLNFTDSLGKFASELAGYGISKLVSVMDDYIDCLGNNPDGPSPVDLQNRIDEINNGLDSLNLDVSGEIDFDKVYQGVDQQIRDCCDSTYNTLTSSAENIAQSAKAAIPKPKTKLPQQFI